MTFRDTSFNHLNHSHSTKVLSNVCLIAIESEIKIEMYSFLHGN